MPLFILFVLFSFFVISLFRFFLSSLMGPTEADSSILFVYIILLFALVRRKISRKAALVADVDSACVVGR